MVNIKDRQRLFAIGGIALLLLVGASFGGWLIVRDRFASPFRTELPPTAKQAQEWRWSEGGLTGQDYVYLLRAKITEQEFFEYVDSFDMKPYVPGQVYSRGLTPDWYPHEVLPGIVLEWWVPSRGHDGVYIRAEGNLLQYAKWENGYIYVAMFSL